MKTHCIPKDVMECIDEAFSQVAFLPHEHTETIEEIWEARGVARVLMFVRQLYQEYHGEDYVPRLFRPTEASADAPDPPGPPSDRPQGFPSGWGI